MVGAQATASLFSALGDERWALLRARMQHRTYAPGDVLIAQGCDPDLHVVSEGMASVSAMTRGRRRELGALGPGDAAGEMAVITGEPASADVIAVTQVTAYVLPRHELAELGELRSTLIEALAGMLAGRLKQANARFAVEREAPLHVLTGDARALGALATLPSEIARVVDGAVLAVHTEAETLPTGVADDARVSRMCADDADALPLLLRRVAHEYEHILVFATRPDSSRHEGATTLRVVREGEAAQGDCIVISERRWTMPALRALSTATSRAIAAVPRSHPPRGRMSPVARLARVMTGRQIGLALGAGAAKGIAHIGVLRALDEMGVPVDVISGSSIGSAIAAGRASGYSTDEIDEIAARIAQRAVRPTLPLHSFLSNAGIREELERVAGKRRFEDLDIPLAISATDIFRRCEVTYTTGPLWPRILASMAIPGIYPALRSGDSYVADGSVLNPVPSRQCRELGAGIVIAVRLTGTRTSPRQELDEDASRPLATETIMRCLEIMHNRLSELSRGDADVGIEVCLDHGGLRDFKLAAEIRDAGYTAATAARSELCAALPYVQAAG